MHSFSRTRFSFAWFWDGWWEKRLACAEAVDMATRQKTARDCMFIFCSNGSAMEWCYGMGRPYLCLSSGKSCSATVAPEPIHVVSYELIRGREPNRERTFTSFDIIFIELVAECHHFGNACWSLVYRCLKHVYKLCINYMTSNKWRLTQPYNIYIVHNHWKNLFRFIFLHLPLFREDYAILYGIYTIHTACYRIQFRNIKNSTWYKLYKGPVDVAE